MPKVANRSDDRLLKFVKNDIVEDETRNVDRSYQMLDDGTLIVHMWGSNMINPIKTYRINMSIGREIKSEEWKANEKEA